MAAEHRPVHALDLLRRELRPTRGGHEAEQETAVESPGIDRAWLSWAVQEALHRLTDDEREIVRLTFYEDLTQTQIAERLHLPVGTVKSRSHRVYRRLAQMFAYVRNSPDSDTGSGNRPGPPDRTLSEARRRREEGPVNANASTGPAPDNEFVERLVLHSSGRPPRSDRPAPAGDGVHARAPPWSRRSARRRAAFRGDVGEPPPALRESILDRVRTEAARSAAAPGRRSRGGSGAEAVVAPDRSRPAGRPVRGRAGFAGGGRSGGCGPGRCRRPRWRRRSSPRESSRSTGLCSRSREAVRCTSSPAPALAPDATVTASVAETGSGFSIWLRTSGLPAAAPGSYYAAWLVGPRGIVPLGSFHGRRSGARIELWSGVDPTDYPIFLVTLQAEGGPSTPSTLVVVTGPLGR